MDTETPEYPADPPEVVEARRAMEEWLAAHPYGDQDENGIDLGLLRRNLRLTPTERLRRLQAAANGMRRLRNAKRTTD